MVNWRERIVSNPGILGGKAVVAGTRISVEIILEQLALEATVEDVIEYYPFLTRDDVLAALAYASEMAGERTAVAGAVSQ
jgi:uncharacterized protein (DUF433 family)